MLSRYKIPIGCLLLGVLISTQLRSLSEALLFLLASIGQFAAYVFVSRLRQRGSFTWHAIAGLGSNGMWYITMGILAGAKAYWALFVLYILGLIIGRLSGSNLAQAIEKRYNLQADATRDDKLAPGKRLQYIRREPMFWALALSLLGYIVYSRVALPTETAYSVLVVIFWGILQNFFYAINTRASARGNNWFIASTGLAAGVTFSISAVYLVSKNMSPELFIPYTLSTALGSTIGAFLSMIVEWTFGLKPDAHLAKPTKEKPTPAEVRKARLPYFALLALGLGWILFQEPLFNLMGWPVSQLHFPVSAITEPVPRTLIMITAALLFMFDSAMHTLTSRAGNRSHTGYHLATLVPKGVSDFFRMSYITLNGSIIDILPVGVLAGCLGSLYGKDVAEKTERWLQASMDVPKEEPKKKLASA